MNMSNTPLRVGVLDDDPGLCDRWAKKVARGMERAGLDASRVEALDLKTMLRGPVPALRESRRSFFEAQRSGATYSESASLFDEFDVIFIDYKLFDEESNGDERVTGLELSYLARAYSDCAVIVSLNSQGGLMRAQRHFDLTMREGVERLENLHVTTADLGNPGLWSFHVVDEDGYRPWNWPALGEEVIRQNARLQSARDMLDGAGNRWVVDLLGFDEEERYRIPAFALDHLGLDGLKTSLEQFLWQSGHVIRGEDIDIASFHRAVSKEDLSKAVGQVHGRLGSAKPSARLFAAALHRWLERMVLPSGDVLIDYPHLISRLPWIAGETPLERGATLRPDDGSPVVAYEFSGSHWLSRPAYRWLKIQDDEALSNDPTGRASAHVFAEDRSAFISRARGARFRIDFPSSNPFRYCAPIQSVIYEPQSRLAE